MAPIFDENGEQIAESIDELVKSAGLRDQVKELPKLREQLAQKDAELAAEKRSGAIYRAGLPNTKMAELFAKAYDGPSDPESVRKAAEEYGLVQPVVESQSEGENFDAETARLQRGTGVTSPGDMPDETAELHRLIQSAKGPKDLTAIMESDLYKRVNARENAAS